VVRDGRGEEVSEQQFRYDGGIGEFCEFLAPDQSVSDVLRLQGVGHFKETVPVLDETGHMTPQEVERDLTVDIALRGAPATTPSCAPSSTSSRRRRGAPTSRASSAPSPRR
jgi:DNA gyrase subunit B